jgi:hypothetical protein
VAALGTVSMGFVDALKAFGCGQSNFGFSTIRRTPRPFLPKNADGAFSEAELLDAPKSNWINGVAKADQKARQKRSSISGSRGGRKVADFMRMTFLRLPSPWPG